MKYLILLLFMCACINEGIIIDKWYEPETFYNTTKVIWKDGKYEYEPYLEYDDPDFCVLIKRTNRRDKRVEVTQGLFNELDVGDAYSE